MQSVRERERHQAPGGRPQPLVFVGKTLWVGCWDTDRLYAIDPTTWLVVEEVAAPGRPYGLAAVGDELRAVVSIGTDDDRFLFRVVPGQGFDPQSKMPCPEFTGSHLAADGSTLYLGQMGNRRIVALDAAGSVLRAVALPTRCAGMGFGPSGFSMISTDEEFEDAKLATLDLGLDDPQAVPVAAMSAGARGLAFDGTNWWTCEREAGEIVSFAV